MNFDAAGIEDNRLTITSTDVAGRTRVKLRDTGERVDSVAAGCRRVSAIEVHCLLSDDPGPDELSLTVRLGAGDDTAVNDSDLGARIEGGDGNDELAGGKGLDQLFGDRGDDGLGAGESPDGSFDDQTLQGGEGNDFIIGDDSAETLHGGEGNDVLSGKAGGDREHGGPGDDRLNESGGESYDEGPDQLVGGPGHDTVGYGGAPIDPTPVAGAVVRSGVRATAGREAVVYREIAFPGQPPIVSRLDGDALAGDIEVLAGTPGDDLLSFEIASSQCASADPCRPRELAGLAGNDTLVGGAQADGLYGQAGDDLLSGNGGPDDLFGGDGSDTVSYADAAHVARGARGVRVTPGDSVANDGQSPGGGSRGEGDNVRDDVENLVGSPYADALFGTRAANLIEGGAGDDRIVGDRGVDTLTGGPGADRLESADPDPDTGGTSADIVECLGADTVVRDARDLLRGCPGAARSA